MKKIVFVLCSIMPSFSSWAWTPNGEASRIKQMIQWENNQKVVVQLESGLRCNIPSTETNLISLALSLYVTQRKATWHCYDATENVGGFSTHRLHRVVVNSQ